MMRTAFATTALLFALTTPALAKDVMDVADLVEKQGPAVVNISTTRLVKRSAGSGFIVSSSARLRLLVHSAENYG